MIGGGPRSPYLGLGRCVCVDSVDDVRAMMQHTRTDDATGALGAVSIRCPIENAHDLHLIPGLATSRGVALLIQIVGNRLLR